MVDNVGTIRRGFAAFAAGDLDTLRTLFDPDIVWHEPGRSAVAGDHQGVDATLGLFGQLYERSGGTFRAELRECGEIAPDLVACLIHISGDLPGGRLDQPSVLLFQLRDGHPVDVRGYSSDQYAQDEAWGPAAITLPDARKETAPVTS